MEEDIKILGEPEKIELINLLRTFKREGIENFIVVRRKKLENLIKGYRELEKELERIKSLDIYKLVEDYETGQLIPKSKIKEIRDKAEVMDYYVLGDVIDDLNKLLEDKWNDSSSSNEN